MIEIIFILIGVALLIGSPLLLMWLVWYKAKQLFKD